MRETGGQGDFLEIPDKVSSIYELQPGELIVIGEAGFEVNTSEVVGIKKNHSTGSDVLRIKTQTKINQPPQEITLLAPILRDSDTYVRRFSFEVDIWPQLEHELKKGIDGK